MDFGQFPLKTLVHCSAGLGLAIANGQKPTVSGDRQFSGALLRGVAHSFEKTSGTFFHVSYGTRRIEDSCAFGYGRRNLCAFQPMSMS